MMGDDMAIRSGGMYGRPESQYTLAMPASSYTSPYSSVLNWGKTVADIYSASREERNIRKQANLDWQALQMERAYNVANFKQKMADTLAQNKMSFYASGLDYKSGSARDVIQSNQTALGNDLAMMEYNYDVQERNIQNRRTAAGIKAKGRVISSAINYMTSLAF